MSDRPPVFFQLYTAFQRTGQLVAVALAGTAIPAEDAALYNQLERAGELTPGDLARLLGMAPSTLTYRLRALTSRGHVERRPNPADGRSALVSLTREGRRAWLDAMPPFIDALRAAEGRLDVAQADVGRALDALSAAVEAELAAVSESRRSGSP